MCASFVPSNLQFPEWQREYQKALFELDPGKLPQRVSVAEFALFKRLGVISENQNPPFLDANRERLKIEDALSKLRLLMRITKEAA